MSAVKSPKSSAKTDAERMTARHKELIAVRMSAEGAGPKMTAMKDLRAHEVEMSVSNVPYVAWSTPAGGKVYNMSPDQLVGRIADLQRVIADTDTPKTTVSTASRLLDKLIDECKTRGLDVPND
jgi:hypothetical protein